MTTPITWVVLFVILAAALLALLALQWASNRFGRAAPRDSLPYRRVESLLSATERSFYEALLPAVGDDWRIFMKVRLLDLIHVPRGTAEARRHRNRVMSKHVDFVLCAPDTLAPMLVIELDDATHDRPDRQARDAFVDRALETAGLPILHIRVQRRYAADDLSVRINQLIRRSPRGLPGVNAQQRRAATPSGH
jgi:very-short-patch-repair endonuclease